MVRRLLSVSRGIDWLSEWLGRASTALVLMMAAVGIYNVFARFIGRYIGVNLSSNTFIEGQWYLYSLVFLLGFPYVLKRNENVRVDFFYANWDARRKAWVNLLGTIFFLFPFCLLVLSVTITPVLFSWEIREVSGDPGGLPRYPLKTMIPVAFVLIMLQGLSEVIKHAAFLRGVIDEVPDESVDEVQAAIAATSQLLAKQHEEKS